MTLKPASDYACPKELLDPLEMASRDEISAAQLGAAQEDAWRTPMPMSSTTAQPSMRQALTRTT